MRSSRTTQTSLNTTTWTTRRIPTSLGSLLASWMVSLLSFLWKSSPFGKRSVTAACKTQSLVVSCTNPRLVAAATTRTRATTTTRASKTLPLSYSQLPFHSNRRFLFALAFAAAASTSKTFSASTASATAAASILSSGETTTATTTTTATSTSSTTTSATTTASLSGVCTSTAMIPPLDAKRKAIIEGSGTGVKIEPLEPLGAAVYGIDMQGPKPPKHVLQALEAEMANRGFLVFKNQNPNMTVDQELAATCWWGSQQLHSTHGVHPATPNGNQHIFRLSNDKRHGILGVGPQWHNDGSFVAGTFSHVGYHIIHPPKLGGTQFSHQGAAFDALPKERQEFWERLSSVNSNSGVVHPCVHVHPISKRKSVWLHLGMTGAVIENITETGGGQEETKQYDDPTVARKPTTPQKQPQFRLLNHFEMTRLFHEYNDLLNNGMEKNGYTIAYEYKEGDFIIIDNLAVAHRASPEAHMPPSQVGLRILHRVTIRAKQDFPPHFGLPQYIDIYDRSPFGDGVWQGGGLGFRWDEKIHMQN